MTPDKILIVDDEDSIRNQLRWGLAGEYVVVTAGTAEEARRMLITIGQSRLGLPTRRVKKAPRFL